ncbi:MAG: hypothetical protein AABZ33_07695 [Chloroflexota bacterium]
MPAPRPSGDSHESHDLLLVAALAAGDLTSDDRDRADRQVTACADCAAVHRDLLAIADAMARMPEPVRPRDFTLTGEDAARLRRPSLRRMLLGLAGPRGFVGRPLAATVTSLGVAGIVFASASGILGGAAAGASPASSETGGNYFGSQSGGSVERDLTPAPLQDAGPSSTKAVRGSSLDALGSGTPLIPVGSSAFVTDSPESAEAPGGAPVPASSGGLDVASSAGNDVAAQTHGRLTQATSWSPLLVVSAAFLAVGLALFALRRIAGRLV